MQQRDTATDRLADVIQVVQLGRRTGILTVERGEGAAFEEGSIMFIDGQIIQASTGWRNGLEAFSWMNTWGFCRYAFVQLPTPTASAPQHSGAIPRITTSDGSKNGKAPLIPFSANHGAQRPPEAASSRLAAPRRIVQAGEALPLIERYRLSRIHRHLFLLIDGQRSAAELARLTGRSQHEVSGLLQDLERAGVIQK